MTVQGLDQLNIPGQTWRHQAACQVTAPDDDLWFSDSPYDRVQAATICETLCPVKDACYQAAVEHGERWGIHGGYDFGLAARGGKKVRPAYCSQGHLIADDMYVRRDGREVRCGQCQRDNAARWAAEHPVRVKASNDKRNQRERAQRAAKRAALEEGAA